MYIYPDNLKAKATMWLWELKDHCGDRNPCIDFRVWIRLCKTVVPVDCCRSICISYHTGGGHFHFEIYPVCLRLFFSGTAKF